MSKKKAVRRERSKAGEIPRILHRKDRNLAFMLIEGRRVYLGPYGSVEAEENRLRVWNEYLTKRGLDPNEIDAAPVTVSTLVNRFLDEAKETYVKRGRSTGSYERFGINRGNLNFAALRTKLPLPSNFVSGPIRKCPETRKNLFFVTPACAGMTEFRDIL